MRRWLVVLLCLSFCACSAETLDSRDFAVVYGADDRRDVYEHPSAFWQQRTRESIVALIRESRMDLSDPNDIRIDYMTLREDDNLCPGERYAEQPSPASCSGTLIGPDLVLTAGHCVEDLRECQSVRYVFGFYYEAEGMISRITSEDLYSCRDLLISVNSDNDDYAIVQLDRPVNAMRVPAPVTTRRSPYRIGSPLVMIGFPRGIAAKIDSGGGVFDAWTENPKYFEATVDAFSGNSGSGVFFQDGTVAGILVRGERDYNRRSDGCYETRVLGRTSRPSNAEDVSYVQRAMNDLCFSDFVTDLCDETGGLCRSCNADVDCPTDWQCQRRTIDPTASFCAAPCSADVECETGHRCESSVCVPEDSGFCDGRTAWRRDTCGRRWLVRECDETEACVEGACVAPPEGDSCDDAIVIEARTQLLSADLSVGYRSRRRGTCGGRGPDIMYAFELTETRQFEAEMRGIDSVLSIRSDCTDWETELLCDDDSDPPGEKGSHIEGELEPGTYVILADSYRTPGPFELRLRFDDEPLAWPEIPEPMDPGMADGGVADAGVFDAGVPDAGVLMDAGGMDAGSSRDAEVAEWMDASSDQVDASNLEMADAGLLYPGARDGCQCSAAASPASPSWRLGLGLVLMALCGRRVRRRRRRP